MKIAVVHDYLCGKGGSERVFQNICEEFPEADIYTLAYNPETTYSYFKTREIHTTWINSFVQSMAAFRWSFPIATYAMESLDLEDYDVVLSSAATLANYVRAPRGRHICYRYMPTRALWMVDEYFCESVKKSVFKWFLPWLKNRDYAAAQRVDRFVAISGASQGYIKKFYDRDSEIIYSPIDVDFFSACRRERKEHFLIVSRLEAWKSVDYAIKAFSELGLPLRVIGTGKEETRLREMAGENVMFLGEVDDKNLAREYAEAKALIFTPDIEYGLIPLEAAASGTPVICYASGGVKETMVPFHGAESGADSPTAVFYPERCTQALKAAVKEFESVTFDHDAIRRHAAKWGIQDFQVKIRAIVEEVNSNAG